MNKKDFSKRTPFWEIPIPDLLALQRNSFFNFLQLDVPPAQRALKGLEKIFREVFPLEDTHRKFLLDFVEYRFGEPRYTPEEALFRGANYTIPLKAAFRLIRKEQDRGGGSRVEEVVEEEVYLCELPFMTPQGTFIINGVERVVIGQLHRSPGVYFSKKGDEHSALLVPARGAWFEVVVDRNRSCWVILDRRRRLPLFTFLRALGYSLDEVFARLFELEAGPLELSRVLGQSVFVDQIRYAQAGEVIVPELRDFLAKKGVEEVVLIAKEEPGVEVVTRSLADDKASSQEEALHRIFVKLRSTPPQSLEVARNTILNMLFDPKRFDLGSPGRFKLNKRLGLDLPIDEPVFTFEDLFRILRRLLEFVALRVPADDFEHLGNRRVKRVGELLENQFRLALLQVAQGVRERAAFLEPEETIPQELINSRLVQNTVMKFFTSNQLCQFLDQINPLSELTHKRRVSALGAGGLTRETAGFEVRDIHYSHYGRLCPIETPEGPNIGLIATVTTYAREDELGFLATPYLRVRSGRVTKELVYLNAEEEEEYTIAQANAPLDSEGRFLTSSLLCRRGGEVVEASPEEVDFMDVSPKQVLAPSTCIIPFLDHDDADRALMGANMQRQAVPLLQPEPPLVATGVEAQFARWAGAVVVADEPGQVLKVDSSHILLHTRSGLLKNYRLKKFVKSNQYTCIHQRPRVREGQEVKEGDLLADGPSTFEGELALGRNLLVAYMPLRGYNYEDAIVISDSLLAADAFTSIQILEFEIQARETKLGPEEITRDIPGATEEELAELDEFGIIRVGAEVKPGDLLVGRITPKGEIELTPEERLLWAIFGEKAHNVKDSSLRVEPGVYGVVISRQVLTRHTQDPLAQAVEQERLREIESRIRMEAELVLERRDLALKKLLLGQTAARGVYDRKGSLLRKKGEVFDANFFDKGKLARVNRFDSLLEDGERQKRVDEVVYKASRALSELEELRKKEVLKIQHGDELPHGVLKWVKVYIAQRRRLSVGDKMAGRHGNKGVVAKILPREDMPYLADGTPVDIVLNPLGVPSRMNIGQILEVHLGWAAERLGYQAVCPVFEGATPEEVKGELRAAGLPEDGKVLLYDGRTGLPFDEKVVVGKLYMMKLNHMVDDKLHARSTGRYSLITQQPLGGKAQLGGQRFGEMEVWALEGYGAAHTLQEMLTVKSDDVEGRAALYEALVKGKNPPLPRVPASFSVLTKELQGLGLELVPEKE